MNPNTARTESRALPALSPFRAAETLDAVLQLRCAGCACAVDTTEDFSVRFDVVADDTAVAVGANRRQRVDCALEAVEDVTLSEIFLVLNEAESYHWSPSLRVGAVIHANARCHRYRPHYR